MLKKLASLIPGYSSLRFRQLGGSSSYWERRYQNDGNSGDGSYGVLAAFKAQVLNAFVTEHAIQSAIEFGSGDGNQLSLIHYPQYLGLDVSPTAVERCRKLFREDASKRFLVYDPSQWQDTPGHRADLALSLDVLYHLVEDSVYHLHLRHLFAAGTRFVVIFSSDDAESQPGPHVRPRKFTEDVARLFPEFELKRVIDPPQKSDFANTGPEKTPASFYIYSRR